MPSPNSPKPFAPHATTGPAATGDATGPTCDTVDIDNGNPKPATAIMATTTPAQRSNARRRRGGTGRHAPPSTPPAHGNGLAE